MSFVHKAFVVAALAILSCLAHAQEKCVLDHVCFALDRSGSVRNIISNIQTVTISVAHELSNLTSPTYSASAFSTASSIISSPTKDVTTFKNRVRPTLSTGGRTNMYAGLMECYNFIENESGKKVIVLITDGQDTSMPTAKELVDSKADKSVAIVAVGIGPNVNAAYLQSFANRYIPVPVDEIGDIVAELREEICEVLPPNSCEKAAKLCDFKFMSSELIPSYKIGIKQDKVFTDLIVSKTGPRIGVLNTNNIVPEFLNETDGTVTPINTVGTPRLTPTHFKPFSFPKTRGSGIGHQTFTGNQLQTSRNRCVRVFFTTYQTLSNGRNPRVLNNVNVGRSDNKCVVFRTI